MHGVIFVFCAIRKNYPVHVTRRRPAYSARHAYSVSCGMRGPASGSSGSRSLGSSGSSGPCLRLCGALPPARLRDHLVSIAFDCQLVNGLTCFLAQKCKDAMVCPVLLALVVLLRQAKAEPFVTYFAIDGMHAGRIWVCYNLATLAVSGQRVPRG